MDEVAGALLGGLAGVDVTEPGLVRPGDVSDGHGVEVDGGVLVTAGEPVDERGVTPGVGDIVGGCEVDGGVLVSAGEPVDERGTAPGRRRYRPRCRGH